MGFSKSSAPKSAFLETLSNRFDLSEEAEEPPSAWRKHLNALKNLPPIFKMVWDAAPGVVSASIALRAIAALVPLAILTVTKAIIDAIYNLTSHHAPLPGKFWWLVFAEFALAATAMIALRVIDFCDTVLAEKYRRYISVRIMKHASSLDLVTFEDPAFYDKLERARVQGTDRIGMIQISGRFIQEVITTATLAAGILLYSPLILCVLVVSIIPTFLIETRFAFHIYSLNTKHTPARREMEYFRQLGGSRESAKEMKLFGLSNFLVDRYSKLSLEVQDEIVHLQLRRLFTGVSFALLGILGYYGSYAFAIHETLAGIISLGTLTLLAGAIAGASSNIQAVLTTFAAIAGEALFTTDLLEFLSIAPKVLSKAHALPAPRPIRKGVEFKNVSFSYPGTTKRVLDNVSFRLEPQERIALVGKNGQGKTTIVKLITRLYDATEGQILLDGTDIREYDLEDLWKEIGVIFQDFMRYDLSSTDNIAVGRIDERDNQFLIRSAAQKSLADDVIRQFPRRYKQRLGVRFDGGVDLSGGEWQKIALARAYLRDAQLLILDEPTAALDARSEHEVFKRFAELTAGKMALLISHRLSTVRMADRVLVLENGRIAEQGHHDQLLKSGGNYAQMYELQAASYR